MKKVKYTLLFALNAWSLYLVCCVPVGFATQGNGWWANLNGLLVFAYWMPLVWFLLFAALTIWLLRRLFGKAKPPRGERACQLVLSVLSLLNTACWGLGATLALIFQ